MGIFYGQKTGLGNGSGSSITNASPNAQTIKSLYPNSTDGVYWIYLPVVGPTQVYCLMDSKWDGGGWMMAMKAAATGTTFQYSANYWTTDNTLNPTDNNQNAGDAKFQTMNRFPAKDIMARWPDISTNGGSIPNTGTWTWMENNFDGGARRSLINFFANTGNRKFIRDAKTFSGWQSGVFSSQVGVRFYGFNYLGNNGAGDRANVRWGFGWNENDSNLFPNADDTSNDVSGGIGIGGIYYHGTIPASSAGDFIGCCNDTTGINRQARVEIYVR